MLSAVSCMSTFRFSEYSFCTITLSMLFIDFESISQEIYDLYVLYAVILWIANLNLENVTPIL